MWTRATLLCALVLTVLTGCAKTGGDTDQDQGEGMTTVTAEQLSAFAEKKVFFAHQSVGANILSGFPGLYAEQGAAAPAVVETRTVPADTAFLAHTLIGTNGDPAGKITQFEALMTGDLGGRIDVAVLKLCYLDVHQGTDVQAVFDAYAAMTERVAAARPDLQVVYTTVPLTQEPSWKGKLKALVTRTTPPDVLDNVAREKYNELVRGAYGGTGRLFDVARVESTTGSGGRTSGDFEGATYYSLDPQWASDPGHLNEPGARRGAAELVRVVTG